MAFKALQGLWRPSKDCQGRPSHSELARPSNVIDFHARPPFMSSKAFRASEGVHPGAYQLLQGMPRDSNASPELRRVAVRVAGSVAPRVAPGVAPRVAPIVAPGATASQGLPRAATGGEQGRASSVRGRLLSPRSSARSGRPGSVHAHRRGSSLCHRCEPRVPPREGRVP